MRLRTVLLIILVIAFSAISVLLFCNGHYTLGGVAVVFLAVISAVCYAEYFRNLRKLIFMLDAFEANDFMVRLQEIGSGRDKLFIRLLNRIKHKLDSEKASIREKEMFYGKMLDNVTSGVIAVDEYGTVVFSNPEATSLFGKEVMNLRQLDNIRPGLCGEFLSIGRDDSARISFFNESREVVLRVMESETTVTGTHSGRQERLRIFTFNDIEREMEVRETESWDRLIRVLTHEIMNNLSPISSISETLYALSSEPGNHDKEISDGLRTINATSKGLMSFVEAYRKVTRIPEPVKKICNVTELIERDITLVSPEISAAGVKCSFVSEDRDILIHADENMISQVIVNLLRNAVQSFDMEEPPADKKIDIRCRMDKSENVIIEIADNGKPIPPESVEQIFVPFFTTKKKGTGIGLSLARQIMLRHNGSIRLVRSNASSTVFALVFG